MDNMGESSALIGSTSYTGPERMTRQLYLGTRYFGLATFIVFFIDTDSGKVPCHVSSKVSGQRGPPLISLSLVQPLTIANYVRAQHPIVPLLDIPH